MSEPLLIPAGNPGAMTGSGNNTWLLDGAEPTLIDAGVGRADHVDAIASALGGRALVRVLITHGHPDHASGAPALRSRWPAVDVRQWPDALSEADAVRAGDAMLTVVHTPGHAADHVCFWDESSRDLYSGDMLVRGSTVMIPAGAGGGLRAYLASLERIAALAPARVLPGHGPVIDDPLQLIAQYIEHRRLRHRQVAACLAKGIDDPDAIVTAVYPELPPALRRAARATIEAHLEAGVDLFPAD
ncbi:MAG TPA: MBL fold metallo-hydrolase [Vicinamibacterales bacterium]|nr:MBL fold metallo-hydrolase [Vicinamibacterales bacterium]